MILGTPQPTGRFTGICTPCKLPVGTDRPDAAGDHLPFPCPKCGTAVLTQRIYGVLTGEPCHGACMGARGPVCECGCGGINHGGMWVLRQDMTATEVAAYEKAVESYRAELARDAEKRAAKAAASRDRLAGERAAWDAEHPALAEVLNDTATIAGESGWFLAELAQDHRNGKILTPGQTAAGERNLERAAKWAAEKAERAEREANAKPLPEGKALTVTGEVVSLKWEDSPFGYGAEVAKMLVVSDDGWRVYGTCPRVLLNSSHTGQTLKGSRVSFTADVKAKAGEASFGYFSRPRKAEVTECCADCKE